MLSAREEVLAWCCTSFACSWFQHGRTAARTMMLASTGRERQPGCKQTLEDSINACTVPGVICIGVLVAKCRRTVVVLNRLCCTFEVPGPTPHALQCCWGEGSNQRARDIQHVWLIGYRPCPTQIDFELVHKLMPPHPPRLLRRRKHARRRRWSVLEGWWCPVNLWAFSVERCLKFSAELCCASVFLKEVHGKPPILAFHQGPGGEAGSAAGPAKRVQELFR